MIKQLHEACRHMDVGVPILSPRLQQNYPSTGILCKPIRQHAASRSSSNDDIIRLHDILPTIYGKAAKDTAIPSPSLLH